ncbi:hypothetical protein M422DRAFT_257968 [Sphaerobolus stellatus SS14]|uniref:Alcohol dehydrogenase-like C-terminal domain-containing protein n=1 Tax=Sphaerobolus stellatus (strain SS14) TaxID=990650 RepID=A0A0C9VNM9_SPHS4|nr:hypothetical protein M422DRAFT_257968 [Sphaerobolus stellatus SS14]
MLADLVWVVPEGTLSHEEATTLGCGFWTAVQALFHPTRLGLTEPPAKVKGKKWLQSDYLQLIRLLAAAGYKVATVSSPCNFELAKSLGATVVFDYNSPGVLDQILTAGSSAHSTPKGKVITILGSKDEAVAYNPNVMIQPTLIYCSLGREFSFREVFPVSKEDRD